MAPNTILSTCILSITKEIFFAHDQGLEQMMQLEEILNQETGFSEEGQPVIQKAETHTLFVLLKFMVH